RPRSTRSPSPIRGSAIFTSRRTRSTATTRSQRAGAATEVAMNDLPSRLRDLGLRAAATSLDDVVARATRERWSATQILEHVADLEDQDRAKRSLERRLSRSRIGRFKPIADFDWSWPKRIDRALVESTLRLGFLGEARNIVLVAPQGLGKTMIAQNLAHEAILAGHSVLVVTAAQLLLDLGA